MDRGYNNMEKFMDIIGLCGGFLVKIFSSKEHRRQAKVLAKMMKQRFFYDKSLVCDYIFDYDGSKICNDRFIHYGDVVNGGMYDGVNKVRVELRRKGQTKTLDLPYVECVDFTKTPDAHIDFASVYFQERTLNNSLKDLTENNLNIFKKEANRYDNNELLCMHGFKMVSPGRYEADVKTMTFEGAARTNLTLDHPLTGLCRGTLRDRELAGSGGGLPSLEDSELMNNIGVSAVWCLDKGDEADGDRYRFYMKCRQKKLSVFNGMMGTVSGYVDAPRHIPADRDMMAYLKEEIKREFYEETGYNNYAHACRLSLDKELNMRVIPLAFVRELMRGGLPQFFFLIVTNDIREKEFAPYFLESQDGKMEFRSSQVSDRTPHPLSPETHANLLYALRYFQRNENLPFIRL